ncbi:MAG: hypothetical protein AUJ28_00810 [Parcubacteria group bacterium CG1_02_37_51]|uniref:Uncharacterized protein n=2 Tax=Candidatus Komeiliibacteriota TaxID=1817908 RepID=A0A2M8DQ80_9BACT|nr:MAG: hypothetical protein AUJ28_00810 [Parcubacteria group bacterium CG1_02_37_51]PIY95215.1 MAG: hypothetical protein COY67_01150 [Candidatus Komeilibacteria bacterium CG_4_10_14_0_8_um_filter_37_78]PJC01089.1 MAG: hypothetical protein CO073_04375 [Candidatus Komeilibacteria bacterium CG_4_9_14_0_8_um_filter_36_9]
MSIKKYLFFLAVFTIIAWILWAMVITYIDPSTSSSLARSLFYITFFFSLLGTFTIIGYLLRVMAAHQEPTKFRINISLRQGTLFALLINISLALKAADKLSWVTILIALVILSLIEFLFLSISTKKING